MATFTAGRLVAQGGEGAFVFILVLVPIVIFVFFTLAYAQRESLADLLTSLAGRWGGRVDRGAILSNPRLEFRVDGVDGEVVLQAGGSRNSSWTRVRFNWPSPKRLRVAPEGFAAIFRHAFGASDIRLGDLGFDDEFWIEASDPAWAKEVLAPELRRGMRNLRNSGSWLSRGPSTVSLDVGSAGLALGVGRILDGRAALESFIELAIAALRAARGGESGVVLATVELKGGSECPVCGNGVEKGVTCPACGTPHHEDCWKYVGNCAIFACPGRSKA